MLLLLVRGCCWLDAVVVVCYHCCPADVENLTYNSLVDSTPSSKKRRYHGVDYCFSNQDFSLDTKLLKIQQSYLVSERASNCSNSCTPQAERVWKEESRRKKAALLQDKQESSKEFEKDRGTDASVRLEAQGESVVEGEVSTGQTGLELRGKDPVGEVSGVKLTPRTKSRRLLKYRRLRGRASWKGSGEMLGGGALGEGSTGEMFESKGAPLGGGSGEEEVGNETSDEVMESGGSEAMVGSVTPSEAMVGSVTASEDSIASAQEQGSLLNPTTSTGSVPVPSTGSVPVLSKRSPRKASLSRGRTPRVGKKENRHKLLGQVVVDALKRNGMPRNHPRFRACFERLFKLSKIFLEVRTKEGIMSGEISGYQCSSFSQV